MSIVTFFLVSFLSVSAVSLPFTLIETSQIASRMPAGTSAEKLSAFLSVLGNLMTPQKLLLGVLFLILYRLFFAKRYRFSLAALICSVIFSVFMLVGECVEVYEDAEPLFRNGPQCLVTLIKFCGYLPLFYAAVRSVFALMDSSGEHAESAARPAEQMIFEKHSFLLPFVILLICWLPYVIAFYPGFVPSDGLKQLNNFFGSGNFTDNHPAFSSMLMGWAMKAGRAAGSDNLGIFLFCGTQLVITALCLSACFPVFRELKTPLPLRRITLAAFALISVWPNYAYSLLKDTLYMDMLLLYALLMIRILHEKDFFKHSFRRMSLLFAAMLLMMLMRHEGKFIVLLSFPFLFFEKSCRKELRTLLPPLLLAFGLTLIFNQVIRPALNIPDSPAREALTLPFRQSAKVIMEHEEELSEEELEYLHSAFSEYERIPRLFSIRNGDNIKGLFSPYASREEVLEYLKVWAAEGLRYPLQYLNVLVSCSHGYTYPPMVPYRELYGWYGIEQESYVNKGLFDIHYAERFTALRSVLINWTDALPKLPLTGLFYSLGLNAWIVICCAAYLLRKEIRGRLTPFLPAFFSLAICLNTAINGFFRYMLPVLICVPPLIAWCIAENRRLYMNENRSAKH